jgi:outer membrane protein assembly factor BamB
MAAPPPSRRRLWFLACARVAVVSGAFTAVLGGMLLFNSVRLYRGAGNGKVRLVEAEELLPLKAALRQDSKNEALKEQLRNLDQRLRRDYFRRERLAARGGWWLTGAAVLFVASLQLALHLRRPAAAMPALSRFQPDPAAESQRAGRAVTATALALVGMTGALVWGVAPRWAAAGENAVAEAPKPPPGEASAARATTAAGEAPWYPTPEEVDRNWPCFRGPGGRATAKFDGLPEKWDGATGANILWKAEVPLHGESSPVLWDGRLYLTGADEKRREVYCYDAADGKLLWKQPVATPQASRAEPPEVMDETGYAASTPVTDGRRVVAMFANGEVAGFAADGKPLWSRHLGTPRNVYGHATSLAMWRHLVLVVFDQGEAEDELSKVLALDAATGATVWSTPRPVPNSWVSPIVIEAAGKPQLITSADPWVIAYDPATGKELWRVECMQGDVACSPSFANGLVYVANEGACLAAIKPDGSGKVVWKWDEGSLPDMCSLLTDGPRVYMVTYGILQAFDALAGKQLWEHDFETEFHASPLLVNGRLWLLSRKGTMIMGEATNDGFTETGRCELGEDCNAMPVFAPGRVYQRGRSNLYCIGTKDGK